MAAVLARLAFAIAAGSALAASVGISARPHLEEPRTPPVHGHAPVAYQFVLLSEIQPPVTEQRAPLSLEMATLHRVLAGSGVPLEAIALMPGMTRGERAATASAPTFKATAFSPLEVLAIEFALLVILAPRLPRPTRRPVAEIPLPVVPAGQWHLPPLLAPPRLAVLP